MNKDKSINKRVIFCTVLLLFLILLCYTFPYSGDDWAWGSKIGIERLNSLFIGYNGRYLGNILVIILTRSQLIRTVIMAITLFGIIYFSYKYSNKKNVTLIYISTLCVVAIPKLVFRQAIVWTSGFTNYSISIFFILIYIYIVRNIFGEERPKYSKKICIPLLILGICNALFVEHITLYSIILAIFVIVYSYIRFKKIYLAQVSYFIGAIVGTIIMFSNSAYSAIANSKDNYRSIPSSGAEGFIQSAINSYFDVIYKELFFNNIILNILITVLAILIVYKYNTSKNNIKNSVKLLGNIIIIFLVSYNIYSIISQINPGWKILLKYTNYFEGILSIIYYVIILILIIIFIKDNIKKQKMLFLLISIAALTAPLFVVKPIGSRCFLATYVIFILLINEFANYVMNGLDNSAINSYINKVIMALIIVFGVYLLSIYGYINKINSERINYVKAEVQSGKKEIVLTKLPYESYLWTATPLKNDLWMDRFKLFYGVPKDTKIKLISLEKWHNLRKNSCN